MRLLGDVVKGGRRGEETYRSRRLSGPAAEASDNKRMLRKKAEVRILKIFFEFGRKRKERYNENGNGEKEPNGKLWVMTELGGGEQL